VDHVQIEPTPEAVKEWALKEFPDHRGVRFRLLDQGSQLVTVVVIRDDWWWTWSSVPS
jgi:hypothetical protein